MTALRYSEELTCGRVTLLGLFAALLVISVWKGYVLSMVNVIQIYWICGTSHRMCPRASMDWELPSIPSDANTTAIPPIIHQQWKDGAAVPDHWTETQASWQKYDYEYMMWNDTAAWNFVAAEFPDFLHTYDTYPHFIQRIDSVRYLLLYRYGGIYSDMDIGSRRPIEPLRKFAGVLAVTQPMGLTNSFMMASPGHPFFKQVIENLVPAAKRSYIFPYATVMLTTGPMFLTAQYARYVRAHGENSDLAILPRRLFSGSESSFFSFVRGSSWHGWDAHIVSFIWKRQFQIFLGFLSVALLIYGGPRMARAYQQLAAMRAAKGKIRQPFFDF